MQPPLAILVAAMVATLLIVGPFHRFAAAYVGCYALGCLLRIAGASEAAADLAWHGLAFLVAVCLPMMRGTFCLMVAAVFLPMLAIDAMRFLPDTNAHEAWWLIYWMVCAQLVLLSAGANWKQARALIVGGRSAYQAARHRHYLREGVC